MANRKISNIQFDPVVQSINRKFATRKTTCTNKYAIKGSMITSTPMPEANIVVPGARYMGAYGRTVKLTGIGDVVKNTFFMRNPMAGRFPSQNELDTRARFAQANQWAREALEDLGAIAHNNALFIQAQKTPAATIKGVACIGYQSMRGWMCAIAFAILKAGETLPSNHQLPNFDAAGGE